jgi:hypothetical protein
MNLRQRALLDVMKIAALGALAGVMLTALALWTSFETVSLIVALAALIYFGKIAYDIRVAQLEAEADRVRRALRDGR